MSIKSNVEKGKYIIYNNKVYQFIEWDKRKVIKLDNGEEYHFEKYNLSLAKCINVDTKEIAYIVKEKRQFDKVYNSLQMAKEYGVNHNGKG